eukprot:TRINITY_DN64251_c0_g1_i1.p1 TRINITY_DN64251_c0_g1~~TRINITY_DN64251_c0_g1_i1.p1  ORF type:complete len:245 (-),score=54.90 TRINITY_DN64251_c0_g1_i1:242-976(-)
MSATDEAAPAVAYLSFNKDVTGNDDDLGPPPSEEELERLHDNSPKLSTPWVLWEQVVQNKDPKATSAYSDATRQVTTFHTVKDFWTTWVHLPQPSELLDGKKIVRETEDDTNVIESLMLFRKGVRPEWEDPANTNGGHFMVQLKPQLGGGIIDELWNNIIIGALSGWIENSDMITGVRIVDKMSATGKQAKPLVRIEVWFNDVNAEDKLYKLRGSMEERMRMRLDGSLKKFEWGNTEMKAHQRK